VIRTRRAALGRQVNIGSEKVMLNQDLKSATEIQPDPKRASGI
jgi:hypothetical protein